MSLPDSKTPDNLSICEAASVHNTEEFYDGFKLRISFVLRPLSLNSELKARSLAVLAFLYIVFKQRLCMIDL